MPGPNSAPNGDSSLVHGWTTIQHKERCACGKDRIRIEHITMREKLSRKGKLRTGKTDHQKRR